MNIVLLQGVLTPQEIELLLKEFPQYLFLSLSEAVYKNLRSADWARLEILYGARLAKEDLARAPQLRWIHCPTPHLNRLCMEEIEKQGNILVSTTVDENAPQIAEFVMSAILGFAKNLFAWHETNKTPQAVWNSKWRDSMWTLKKKLLVQIGLDKAGTEIAKHARQMDMRVWGVQSQRSFHPYCHKTFELGDLQTILPEADVVSVNLGRGKKYHQLLKRKELELMKEDSILIILGPSSLLQEDALAQLAEAGKFRGILLDAWYQTPIAVQSMLWKIPHMLITPEIAPRPKSTERLAFRLFLYNLRQYLHGNFKDMRNLVEETSVLIK